MAVACPNSAVMRHEITSVTAAVDPGVRWVAARGLAIIVVLETLCLLQAASACDGDNIGWLPCEGMTVLAGQPVQHCC
jgi:hypothetical protein